MIGLDKSINSKKQNVRARGHLSHVKRPCSWRAGRNKNEALQSTNLNLDKPSCIKVRVLMAKEWDLDPLGGGIWVDALEHFEPQVPPKLSGPTEAAHSFPGE